MITAKKFDLGNGGYTTSYRCSSCFKVFEINFLSVSENGKPYRITAFIEGIHCCPFCGEKTY